MAIQGKFKSSREVRDEGVWVPLPGGSDTSRLRVRSEDYGPYRKAIGNAIQRSQGQVGVYTRRKQQDVNVDTLEFERARGEAYGKHIIVDWDIDPADMSEDGAKIPYSKELAVKLLTDPDTYDFYLACVEAVTKLTNDKGEWETDRKKSSATDSPAT